MSNSKPSNADLYIKGAKDIIHQLQKIVVKSSKSYEGSKDHDSLLLGDILAGLFVITIQVDEFVNNKEVIDKAITEFYNKESVDADTKIKITIVKEV